jgi:hypothetical protein
MIHAKNNKVIAFDNLSGLSRMMSDNLCRLSTGGGFSTRSLYSDYTEVVFDAKRPMILNGIDNIASRNDLADRAIIANLPRIPEEKRKLERHLWNEFEAIQPEVLGAILDAVSCALKNFDKVKLGAKPRMSDFAQWIVAAEPKLPWNSGSFLKIYNENRSEAMSAIFESDLFAMKLKDFIQDRKSWSGTASDLKKELERCIPDDEITKNKYWPKAPNKVSQKINQIAPSLRSVGIKVEFIKGGKIWKFKCK